MLGISKEKSQFQDIRISNEHFGEETFYFQNFERNFKRSERKIYRILKENFEIHTKTLKV